jgi:hypothetical protein
MICPSPHQWTGRRQIHSRIPKLYRLINASKEKTRDKQFVYQILTVKDKPLGPGAYHVFRLVDSKFLTLIIVASIPDQAKRFLEQTGLPPQTSMVFRQYLAANHSGGGIYILYNPQAGLGSSYYKKGIARRIRSHKHRIANGDTGSLHYSFAAQHKTQGQSHVLSIFPSTEERSKTLVRMTKGILAINRVYR